MANKKQPETVESLLAQAGVTEETLGDTVDRAVNLVRAAGTSRVIRANLMEHGYTTAIHNTFWRLIRQACGTAEDGTIIELEDPEVRASVEFVDSRDEKFFRILKATLKHNYPEQAAYVLRGDLGPSTGMDAVLSMEIALDRLDDLQNGAERKATRKQDHEALALLATRKIDANLLQDLRKHVKIAKTARPVTMADVTPGPDPNVERVKALISLRALYQEWSEIAKAVIKRRDLLIRMGLATRHPAAKAEDDAATNENPEK